MVRGEVSTDREAIVPLLIRSSTGDLFHLEAVLDSGFTEYLTLPAALIAQLGLQFLRYADLEMADGSVIQTEEYAAVVFWDGQDRNIVAEATEGDVLIGMALLYGSRVGFDVIDGGLVTISALTAHP